MFVPPYSLILRHVARTPGDGDRSSDSLTIPRKLLDFLLRSALEHAEFDEVQYLKCNPDVALAIRGRQMKNAREHYIRVGYFEGRTGAVPVQEDWYLARNPDVAAAKRSKQVESGEMQYRIAGASEWRQPNARSVQDVDAWKALLERK